MNVFTRQVVAILMPIALIAAACGTSNDEASDDVVGDSTSSTEATKTTEATSSVDSTAETSAAESADSIDGDPMSWFSDGALTSEATTVPCTLENGSETTCYQVEVASLGSTVDTDGPYCPETLDDTGGIWVWDGDEPGLYALDAKFWAMMESHGYEFVDADGNISITDPAAGGADSAGTANSCLEATPDGSFHLQVLLPTAPELLESPVDLLTISQIGLALDGVTIFGDAPSVADRGGLLEQDVEALIGFGYDGYPIYGPEEDREIPTDLDGCSGHVTNTDEFGETYHYHLTYDSPNLPTCRVGASAVGTLTSPDNPNASLPSGEGGPQAGGDGGPPPGDDG